jgi:hypothetical protein
MKNTGWSRVGRLAFAGIAGGVVVLCAGTARAGDRVFQLIGQGTVTGPTVKLSLKTAFASWAPISGELYASVAGQLRDLGPGHCIFNHATPGNPGAGGECDWQVPASQFPPGSQAAFVLERFGQYWASTQVALQGGAAAPAPAAAPSAAKSPRQKLEARYGAPLDAKLAKLIAGDVQTLAKLVAQLLQQHADAIGASLRPQLQAILDGGQPVLAQIDATFSSTASGAGGVAAARQVRQVAIQKLVSNLTGRLDARATQAFAAAASPLVRKAVGDQVDTEAHKLGNADGAGGDPEFREILRRLFEAALDQAEEAIEDKIKEKLTEWAKEWLKEHFTNAKEPAAHAQPAKPAPAPPPPALPPAGGLAVSVSYPNSMTSELTWSEPANPSPSDTLVPMVQVGGVWCEAMTSGTYAPGAPASYEFVLSGSGWWCPTTKSRGWGTMGQVYPVKAHLRNAGTESNVVQMKAVE